MRTTLASALVWVSLAGAVVAEPRDIPRDHKVLFEVLRLDEMVEVMRDEAIAGAHGLSENCLGDPASEVRLGDVRRINRSERMRATLEVEN